MVDEEKRLIQKYLAQHWAEVRKLSTLIKYHRDSIKDLQNHKMKLIREGKIEPDMIKPNLAANFKSNLPSQIKNIQGLQTQ